MKLEIFDLKKVALKKATFFIFRCDRDGAGNFRGQVEPNAHGNAGDLFYQCTYESGKLCG